MILSRFWYTSNPYQRLYDSLDFGTLLIHIEDSIILSSFDTHLIHIKDSITLFSFDTHLIHIKDSITLFSFDQFIDSMISRDLCYTFLRLYDSLDFDTYLIHIKDSISS